MHSFQDLSKISAGDVVNQENRSAVFFTAVILSHVPFIRYARPHRVLSSLSVS